MKQIEVVTGFGYFKDAAGNVECKARLPIGIHPMRDDYTYVEVGNATELGAVTVHEEPPTEEQINEVKIQKKMRELAITELKKTGELAQDYKDK